jgi:hypothetical protein
VSLEREQEKRGAKRSSGRGKCWAKADVTKPTPKPTWGTSKGCKVWCSMCIIWRRWVQLVERCSMGHRGSSAVRACRHVQPNLTFAGRNDLNRHSKCKSRLALMIQTFSKGCYATLTPAAFANMKSTETRFEYRWNAVASDTPLSFFHKMLRVLSSARHFLPMLNTKTRIGQIGTDSVKSKIRCRFL